MQLSDYDLLVWQTHFAELNQDHNDPTFRRTGTRMLCSVLQQILEFPERVGSNRLGIHVTTQSYGGPDVFDVSFSLRRGNESMYIHVTDTCIPDAYQGWVWFTLYGEANTSGVLWSTAPVREFLKSTG